MPPPVAGAVILRKSTRRDLVRALERLASSQPEERADAALRAANMVQACQASWSDLLVPAVPDDAASTAENAWPAPVLMLLERPGLTAEDQATLRRLAAWRAPGRAGRGLLREIEARVVG